MKKKFMLSTVVWAVTAAAIVLADQLVKRNILTKRAVGEIFGEIPGICDFIYVKNTGAAFSMLSGNTVILTCISVIFAFAVIIFWIWKKPRNIILQLSLALIFAGAVGNGIDRAVYGFVVDFISVKWFDFPVFNIADIAIVVGAILIVLYEIIFDKTDSKEKSNG